MEKRNVYNCLDANKTYFYIMLLSCVLPLVAGIIFVASAGMAGMTYSQVIATRWAIYISIVLTPIAYIALYCIYHARNKIAFANKPKVNLVYVVMAVVFAGISLFAIAPITNWIAYGLESIGLKMDSALGYSMNTWWQVVLGIVGYAVLPAVAEELLYRRVILSGMLSKHTVAGSVIITAIMFTLMHGSIKQFFYQLILGFVLTGLAYVTKSVIYPMIMHLLNNLAIVIITLTGSEYLVSGGALSDSYAGNILGYLGLAVAGVAVIFLALKFMHKQTSKSDNSSIIEIKSTSFTKNQNSIENTYFYMSMALAIILWVSNTILSFV